MVMTNNNLELLNKLKANQKVAANKLAVATAELDQIDKDITAVIRTIELHSNDIPNRDRSAVTISTDQYLAEDFRGLSQTKAVEKLAKEKGGVFKVTDVKLMLIGAGLTDSKKPYAVASSLLQRNSSLFERVGKGSYRLLDQSSPDRAEEEEEQQRDAASEAEDQQLDAASEAEDQPSDAEQDGEDQQLDFKPGEGEVLPPGH